ncbi:MAG TPA: CehA/McbA family metallohydrolase, partial [Mycobacteriales bacterium]|nr:CehA/McbA family metallohydrolase [Mycobacteriales bacterium]
TADSAPLAVRLDRWIDPAARGYYSGDPHIHGGGCSHYSQPTEGVTPETMIRHARGEAIWVSSVLTWGPCYYYQKQFFTGRSISPPAGLEFPAHQEAQGVTWEPQTTDRDGESVLRYDVEISGFPSSHSGHLILLGLTDQDYPGTSILEDWPSWNLPIHQWAQAQGALTGFAHCGLGMSTASRELPNFDIPPFTSIGSNELVVDVPHNAADFIAGAEFAVAAEMNIWYHLLNAGFRTMMLGETDFPCVSDERPGIGRTYVSLPSAPAGDRALEQWIDGLRTRASYFGDGRSHAFDFALDGDSAREQRRNEPGRVRLTATVAALLPEERPEPTVAGFDYDLAPADPSVPDADYTTWGFSDGPSAWHLEWARNGDSRTVDVEIVVNGQPVATRTIVADGSEQDVAVDIDLERSSWVALRLLPSLHTQPIFVEIGDQPIRASRRSAQWLHDCVDALWAVKQGFIRPAERTEARAAYDQAQSVYATRRDESEVD